ncbi:MAG: 7-cyano-7-deazaguanine synthase [Nitrospirae bacterium]|nr:7-cyano-7-deazaguanine synthase [Nitrospirota bacterium]
MSRALALFSGGLDSMLAVRVVMEQGVEVIALQFITPFFNYRHKGREAESSDEFLAKFGFPCMIVDVSEEYIAMLRSPRYGYGKNFNPCIDCKIFMMKRAKEMMSELGADFIVSGEVLGQRPMSQRRDAMRIVERDSGLDYYLLRPLCAKHMKPTYPEEHGLIDREKLHDISGRARRRQMDLAEAYGISDYQSPAGGCLLTDPIISQRIAWLLQGGAPITVSDVAILAVGRHFSVPGGRLYVGRNKEDNRKLGEFAREGDFIFKIKERPGTLVLFRGTLGDEDIRLAAAVATRYSDVDDGEVLAVGYRAFGGEEMEVMSGKIGDAELEEMRVKY